MTEHIPLGTGDGGGGGPPSGNAGGDLGGTYPNPTVDQATAPFEVKSGSDSVLVVAANTVDTVNFALATPGGLNVLQMSGSDETVDFSQLIIGPGAGQTVIQAGNFNVDDDTVQGTSTLFANDTNAKLILGDHQKNEIVSIDGGNGQALGFFGGDTVNQPDLTGTVSAIVDPNAKAAIESIIAAIGDGATGVSLATDSTT